MARNFGTAVNLARHELQNARVQNLGAAPTASGNGDRGLLYYDTSTTPPLLYIWSGSAWVEAGRSSFDRDRANHSGTQLASTISDFNTAVRTNRLDQMAAPTAAVSFNSQRITSLADPTAGTDAANKQYVDGIAQGVSFKDSARLTTLDSGTASITTVNGAAVTIAGTTLDGITPATGDRILIRHAPTAANTTATQTSTPSSSSANGIYRVSAVGSNIQIARADDLDSAAEVDAAFVFIEDGTAAGTSYVTISEVTTLNTDPIVWTQFGAANALTFNAPLSQSGNAVSANLANAPATAAASLANGAQSVSTVIGLGRTAIAHFRGDGTTVAWTFSGLSTVTDRWFATSVRDTTGQEWEVDPTGTTTAATVTFGTAPTAGTAFIAALLGV